MANMCWEPLYQGSFTKREFLKMDDITDDFES